MNPISSIPREDAAAALDMCWKRIGTWGDRTCGQLSAHGHCRNCPVYAAGAARLLDTEVSADYLVAGAKYYAEAKTDLRVGAKSVVVFRVAGEWLALPTRVFLEVASVRRVHSLPHRRGAVVRGLVNVRGELLICVSLPVALGLPHSEGPLGATARHAVVGNGADRFVFMADEIAGLHRYNDDDVGPLPATLAHAQATHTRGLLHWHERPVGLLDEEQLFATLNGGLA
jgi:chemotaxis-related protein WspD